jgi:hypothetical protein
MPHMWRLSFPMHKGGGAISYGEWDSLDDAVAFYKSKAWTDLASERDKSQKTIRRYAVKVEK